MLTSTQEHGIRREKVPEQPQTVSRTGGSAAVHTAVALAVTAIALMASSGSLLLATRALTEPAPTRSWDTQPVPPGEWVYASRSLSFADPVSATIVLATWPELSDAGVRYSRAVAYRHDAGTNALTRQEAAWDWTQGPPCMPGDPGCTIWGEAVPVARVDSLTVDGQVPPVTVYVTVEGRPGELVLFPENP